MCLVNMRGEIQVIKGGLIQEKGLAVNYKKTKDTSVTYLVFMFPEDN